MKTINVSELSGAALDWAVAVATGHQPEARVYVSRTLAYISSEAVAPYMPSTDWSQGGPLFEPHWLMLDIDPHGQSEAKAYMPNGSHWTCFGHTPLVAACRAIVGVHARSDTVEVPEELL